MSGIKCSYCHFKNDSSVPICQKCGNRICLYCNLTVQMREARICPHCGHKLTMFVWNKSRSDYPTFYPLVECGKSILESIKKEDNHIINLIDDCEHSGWNECEINKLNSYLDEHNYGINYYIRECAFDDRVWLPLPNGKEYEEKRGALFDVVEEVLKCGNGGYLDWILNGYLPLDVHGILKNIFVSKK